MLLDNYSIGYKTVEKVFPENPREIPNNLIAVVFPPRLGNRQIVVWT